MWKFIFCLVIVCFVSGNTASAQSTPKTAAGKELYAAIAHMDSVLFNAFNARDTNTLKKVFSTELEFYHDKSGLTDYNWNIHAFSELAKQNTDLKRELIAGSLEVYPVNKYGAIQVGQHRFCHTENGKPDCGVFKFVHIWKQTADGWKLARVVSYDH